MNVMTQVADHLWQSTLFAGAAMLLVRGLARGRAQVRHWIWLAASVKFLVPFSLLITIGNAFEWRSAPTVAAPLSAAVEQIGQPFAAFAVAETVAQPRPPSPAVPIWLGAIWLCGTAAVLAIWCKRWARIRVALRAASPVEGPAPIRIVSSPALLEPGVFGIFRPVLLLPEGIAGRLTPAQLRAILAHEWCHVRRRDNLAAAIHMVVQAAFWFHPLVWWIGARLVDERERACDEEVLRLGNEPQAYAEGILNVCKFYLESPLACASGVTGSDLRKRMEDIMSNRISQRLTTARKLLLAAAGMTAVAGPVLLGMLNAPRMRAQSKGETPAFEVASIRPADPDSNRVSMAYTPDGGLSFVNVTVKQLIANAYNIVCGKFCDERISGGPKWMDSARFDVLAKNPQVAHPGRATREEIRQCAQALLADRFKLVIRRETREMPVYHLVVARSGHKLREYVGEDQQGGIRGNRPGELIAERASLYGLVANLTGMLGRPVIDLTGLTGRYDFKLEWTPEMLSGTKGPGGPGEKVDAGAPAFTGPSLFTALQEQLGLRLEATRGPVEIFVIDGVEKPSAN